VKSKSVTLTDFEKAKKEGINIGRQAIIESKPEKKKYFNLLFNVDLDTKQR
jgi:hypothetical protein